MPFFFLVHAGAGSVSLSVSLDREPLPLGVPLHRQAWELEALTSKLYLGGISGDVVLP